MIKSKYIERVIMKRIMHTLHMHPQINHVGPIIEKQYIKYGLGIF